MKGLLSRLCRVRRLAVLPAVMCVITLRSEHAHAQLDWHQTAQPTILRGDLSAFLEEHVTSEEVRFVIEDLYADYQRDHATAREALRERIRTGGSAVVAEWYRTRGAVTAKFASQVGDLLGTDEAFQWGQFHRAQWRGRLLAEMNPYQSRKAVVDLVREVETLQLSEPERLALDPIIESYVSVIDSVLERFDIWLPDALEQMAAEHPRPGRLEGLHTEFEAILAEVLAINDRFGPQFASALKGTNALTFAQRLQLLQFPQLYAPTIADRLVEIIRVDEMLTQLVGASLDAQYQSYQSRLRTLRSNIQRKTREWNDPKAISARDVHYAELRAAQSRGEFVNPDDAWAGNPAVEDLHAMLGLERRFARETRALLSATSAWEAAPVELRLLVDTLLATE